MKVRIPSLGVGLNAATKNCQMKTGTSNQAPSSESESDL